jgi:hypothetical protein
MISSGLPRQKSKYKLYFHGGTRKCEIQKYMHWENIAPK